MTAAGELLSHKAADRKAQRRGGRASAQREQHHQGKPRRSQQFSVRGALVGHEHGVGISHIETRSEGCGFSRRPLPGQKYMLLPAPSRASRTNRTGAACHEVSTPSNAPKSHEAGG